MQVINENERKWGKHIQDAEYLAEELQNLQDAEHLAEELQKYLCLYEKGNKGYKERN